MHIDPSVLGISFAEWLSLTEEYSREMEALRRREPGASSKMQDLAKRMQSCEEQVVAAPAYAGKNRVSALKQVQPARREDLWNRAAAWIFGENTVAAWGTQPERITFVNNW